MLLEVCQNIYVCPSTFDSCFVLLFDMQRYLHIQPEAETVAFKVVASDPLNTNQSRRCARTAQTLTTSPLAPQSNMFGIFYFKARLL